MQQISLFDPPAAVTSLFTGGAYELRPMEDWMLRLKSDGDGYIMVGPYPCVLYAVPYTEAAIEPGHRFQHYAAGGQLYNSVFVGQEAED